MPALADSARLTITLSPDLKAQIIEEADRRGVSASRFISDLALAHFTRSKRRDDVERLEVMARRLELQAARLERLEQALKLPPT